MTEIRKTAHGTERTERDHWLIIEDLGDGELDRWIEHPEGCPTEVRSVGPLEGQVWEEYLCGTGYWAYMYGLDELKDDLRFNTPGKHKLGFFAYTPISSYEDHEVYLEFIDG